MTPKRRATLIRLLIFAAAIDFALKLLEIPFFEFAFMTVTVEEIIEQFISTWLARGKLKLGVLDRAIGFIPIPGVTPVTVRVIRELVFNKKDEIG